MWSLRSLRTAWIAVMVTLGGASAAMAQGPLTNGQNHVGVINTGDSDSWTFTADSGAAILLRMGEIGGDSDLYPYLQLYAPNGTLLTWSASPVVASVSATAATAGTYTVVATTNDSGLDASGDYHLTLGLIPGTPVVPAGDEGGALTNGLNHQGVIHVGDMDQWTVTANAGSAILARVGEIGGDSELYPYLLIYSPSGALLDWSASPHVASVGVASAPLTGVYTIVVTTNDSGLDASGDYQLTMGLIPGTPQVSPGDQGNGLTNGLNHAGEIHVGDIDQWTVTANAGSAILARVGEVGGDSEFYPYLLIYGPNGALLDWSASPHVASIGVASAPLNGVYTIVVMSNDSGLDGAGDYLLTMGLIPGTPQVSPGDHGGPLTNGLNHAGEIHVGDIDQWTVTVNAGSAILARVGEIGGDSEFYPYLLIYGPNGALLDWSASPHVASVGVASAPLNGVYTIVVMSNDSGLDGAGDYLLTVAPIPGTPQISPGDQGGALTNGRNHAGEIHVGDIDQWTVSATAGSAILARVGEVGGDSEFYPYLLIYGPNGALLDWSASPHVASIGVASAPLNGVYTIVVMSNDSGLDGAGDYLLTMGLIPGAPEVSPGDQGGALTNGENHSGEIHVGDIDQWTVTANAGSAIIARVGEVDGDSDFYPYLLIYGPNGALLDWSASPHAAAIGVASAPLNGTYTIVVMSNDSGLDGAGDYLLTMALVPGIPVVPSGDQGGWLTNGATTTGALHVADLDQWKFTAIPGAQMTLTVNETGGDSVFYPQVALYGPNGALVTYANGTVTAQISGTLSTPGVYTAVVTTVDSGYDATGSYQITATGIAEPVQPVDLRLTKAASFSVAEPGGTVTYALVATNLGATSATGVTVIDTLPAGLAFVSCSAPGGTCGGSGNARTITYPTIAAGASQTISIVATVTAAVGSTITNTATIAAVNADPVSANDSGSVAITVHPDPLPNDWETRFGLDPGSASGDDGGAGDPDHDGLSNEQELTRGTHPRGFYSRFLPEGARNDFFDARFAVLNVGGASGRLLFRFLQSNGSVLSHFIDLPPNRRITIDGSVLSQLTTPDFSAALESDQPIVFDRTMTWANGLGSHAETGVPSPSTTWYLAEGATAGDFSLFYLLQNPNPGLTTATVKYLLPGGQAPITKLYDLPGNSRTTIFVDVEDDRLAQTDVSAVITTPTGAPIIVERAMYRSTPSQTFAAGHGSSGVTAPSTHWFFAEGATGPFFDCFILLANPGTQPANVTITYLLDDGRTFTKPYSVPAEGRYTVYVDAEEIPAGSGIRPLEVVAVSSTVTSDVPIIAERAMWWPGPGMGGEVWSEAHNSPGATVTDTLWALAEGEVGGVHAAETYILIANTSATPGSARVTLYFADGTSAQTTVPLLPRSRRNVNVSGDFPNRPTPTFSAVIESLAVDGQPAAQIVVERAMYTSPGGHTWTAGTNALATPLRR